MVLIGGCAVDEVTFGFYIADIDQLAAELARTLGIRLYSHSSPMIGPWYSSQDLNAMTKALREGGPGTTALREAAALSTGQSYYELVLNNPEPGYTAPEFPGGGDCLLRVRAGAVELKQIERKLHNSDLPFKRLKGQGGSVLKNIRIWMRRLTTSVTHIR